MVRLRVILQDMNASQCNVLWSRVCVFSRGHEAAAGLDPKEPAEGTTWAVRPRRLCVSALDTPEVDM